MSPTYFSGNLKLLHHVKVDFGDFQFMRIEPKAVRYVSGVATALLGSGGLSPVQFLFLN